MSINTDQFIENILDRIVNGSSFDEDELDKISKSIDKKLLDVNERISKQEDDLNDEFQKLKLHSKVCESDPPALHCFLNNVIQAAEHNVGLEDHILSELVLFCNRNCIAFPSSSINTDDDTSSVNTCVDEVQEQTLQLWIKIKNKLKFGIIALLKKLPMSNTVSQRRREEPVNDYLLYLHSSRLRYFELLSCIFPIDDVICIYCEIRKSEIEMKSSSVGRNSVTFAGDTETSLSRMIEVLNKMIEASTCMLYDDMELFLNIKLENIKVLPFQNLFAIYSKTISFLTDRFINFFIKETTNDTIPSQNDLQVLEVLMSRFSASNLRSFAKVFYMLNNWANTITKVIALFSEFYADETLVKTSEQTGIGELVNDSSNKKSQNLWNWKSGFVPLERVLKKVILSYTHCIYNVVLSKCAGNEVVGMPSTTVAMKLLNYNTCYPLMIAENCATFISLVSEIVLFGKDDKSGVLNEVRDAAIVSVIDVCDDYSLYLQGIVTGFEASYVDIKIIYEIVSNAAFIENQLDSWHSITSGSQQRSDFFIVKKKYETLSKQCVNVIIMYHLNLIKSSIVYDMYSNNWEDEKDFFEGERCSFTIQMWNYYMKGLVYDIKEQLPIHLSKYVLKEISSEMLIFFTSRYMLVKASYRRMKQVRADILVLLKIFKWLLLLIVDNISEYLDLENNKFKKWHSLCTSLFETLIITTMPISTMCSILETRTDQDVMDEKLEWYKHIESSNPASYSVTMIALQILNNYRVQDWNILCQLLALDNASLPILMVENIKHLKQPIYENHVTVDTMNAMFNERKRKGAEPLDQMTFTRHLYNVLLRISVTSFKLFMAALIEGDYSKSFKVTSMDQLPLWLQLIAHDLQSTLRRILTPALNLLHREDRHRLVPTFTFTKLQQLPCGCVARNETREKQLKGVAALLHHCLMTTLSMLVDNIAVIPSVIWDLIAYVKAQSKFTASWTQQSHLGTKILACLLFNWISIKENLNFLTYYAEVSQETYHLIKMFAELLWHTIYNLTHDITDNPKISMDLYKYLQKVEIEEKLTQLEKYCNREQFECDKSKHTSSNILEFDCSSILTGTKTGQTSLEFISSILNLNQTTIETLLLGNHVNNNKQTEHFRNKVFNPMVEFQCVGNKEINHLELLVMELEWDVLVPLISLCRLKILLLNRFEFQDVSESILTADEKGFVTKIKKILNIYNNTTSGNVEGKT